MSLSWHGFVNESTAAIAPILLLPKCLADRFRQAVLWEMMASMNTKPHSSASLCVPHSCCI